MPTGAGSRWSGGTRCATAPSEYARLLAEAGFRLETGSRPRTHRLRDSGGPGQLTFSSRRTGRADDTRRHRSGPGGRGQCMPAEWGAGRAAPSALSSNSVTCRDLGGLPLSDRGYSWVLPPPGTQRAPVQACMGRGAGIGGAPLYQARRAPSGSSCGPTTKRTLSSRKSRT
jgi:hypothetical protein